MDEPLASLDEARKAEVLPFIERLSSGLSIPILYVSHSLNEILNLADTLVMLDSGRVSSVGRVEDMVNQSEFTVLRRKNGNGSSHVTEADACALPDRLLHLPRN
jgi:molybdate transport system ATP-binding protein